MPRAVLTLAVLALLPSPAAAATLVSPEGHPYGGHLQRWVDRSLVPTVPGDVTLTLGRCPGAEGAAGCARPPAQVWLVDYRDHLNLLHELGHVFDYQRLTDTARSRFERLRHMQGQPWRSSGNSPAEQFAEAYRLCALSRRPVAPTPPYPPNTVAGGDGYVVTLAVHRRVCALVRSVG